MVPATDFLPAASPGLPVETIVILADNDDGGRNHAERKAALVQSVAHSVRVIHFPELSEKGDVSDWIALGNGREDLQRRAEDTPKWIPPVATARPPSVGSWQSSVVTAEALRTKQFPLPQIILPGLICEGVTIPLQANPRSESLGWHSTSVSPRPQIASRYLDVSAGDVLYLALEGVRPAAPAEAWIVFCQRSRDLGRRGLRWRQNGVASMTAALMISRNGVTA